MEQELVRKRSPLRRQPLTSTNKPGGVEYATSKGKGEDDATGNADSAFERVFPQARGKGERGNEGLSHLR